MSYQLKVGELFQIYGKSHKILDIQASQGIIKAQRCDDLIIVDLKANWLLKEETFRILNMHGQNAVSLIDSDFNSLEENIKNQIRESYELIEPCILYQDDYEKFYEKFSDLINSNDHNNFNLTALMKARAKMLRDQGIHASESKLWRLWKRFNTGGYRGLKSEKGKGVMKRKDNNSIKIINVKKDEVLQIIPCRQLTKQVKIMEDVINSFYLKPKSPSKIDAYVRIKGECIKANVPVISVKTVYRILDSIEERYQVLFRQGQKEHDKKYRQVESRRFQAQGPLHIVQIDHTLLDIHVVDDERKEIIGRPWITVGIDEYCRIICCSYIGWEPPSANVVAKAIIQGVLPKKAKELYGTKNEWEVYGVPNIIYCDNGKEFHSKHLEQVVKDLKIELRYRPPGIPHYGGICERFFGTLNTQLIHTLEGTTKSNFKQIGERNPEKEACLTLSELKKIIMKYIVDIYPYQEHRGLPKECPLPTAYYKQGLEKFGLPRVIPLNEEESLNLIVLPEKRRKITREGISVNNVLYSSDQTRAVVGYENQRIKVDPYDISYIYLMHPVEKKWVKIPARQPTAAVLDGVTEYEWQMIKKARAERGKAVITDIPQTSEIPEIRKQIYMEAVSAKNKTMKVKRQAARIKTTGKSPRIEQLTAGKKLDLLEKLNEIRPVEELETKELPDFIKVLYEKNPSEEANKPIEYTRW